MSYTYNGATAASTAANPPVLIWSPAGGAQGALNSNGFGSMKLWFYSSTNAYNDLLGATGGFTDGPTLGMAPGDLVIGVLGASTAGSSQSIPFMALVASSTGSTGSYLTTGIIYSS